MGAHQIKKWRTLDFSFQSSAITSRNNCLRAKSVPMKSPMFAGFSRKAPNSGHPLNGQIRLYSAHSLQSSELDESVRNSKSLFYLGNSERQFRTFQIPFDGRRELKSNRGIEIVEGFPDLSGAEPGLPTIAARS